MKAFLLLFATSTLLSLVESKIPEAENGSNKTVHFFMLMIPDSTIQEIKRSRARQEEEAAIGVAETGTYVGQIISGVLGGDVRPIFAGSASFIDEPDVQQGVSTILANVASPLNNILKGWVNRAQTLLGIKTTLRPGQVVLNQTNAGIAAGGPVRPSYGTIGGQSPITLNEISSLQTIRLQQQLAQIQQQAGQQQQQQQQQYRPQTIPGSNVISGYDLYDLTTVPPLPIIKLRPDEDDDEFKKVVRK